MLGFLEKLRQKPESARRRFAFLVSASILLVLVIFWLGTFSDRFFPKKVQVTASAPSPFSSIIQNFKDGVAKIKGTVASNPIIKNIATTSSTTSEVIIIDLK